jgi:hypothetical protein
MRRILMVAGVLGALLPAAPAAADFTAFNNWAFCSGTSLDTCFNFTLLRDGTSDNYRLMMEFVSSEGLPEGMMTAAGLYQDGTGTGINISDIAIEDFSDGDWEIGEGGLAGGGGIEIVAAASAISGINDGVPTGGWVLISFTSDNIDEHLATLYARAHIQGFGDNSCSLKPDSNLGVVDGVAEVDARCGTSTVPEPISMVLLGSGLLGIGGVGYRRRKQAQ